MAELTGRNQATILYKTSDRTGEPLDINGAPIAVSGKRQAIMLMAGGGVVNPDPQLYEVEGFYGEGSEVNGTPSWEMDPDKCPAGEEAVWVLDTGFWDNSAYWLDDGIWNY